MMLTLPLCLVCIASCTYRNKIQLGQNVDSLFVEDNISGQMRNALNDSSAQNDTVCYHGSFVMSKKTSAIKNIVYDLAMATDSTHGIRLDVAYINRQNDTVEVVHFSGTSQTIVKNTNDGETLRGYKLNLGDSQMPVYFKILDDRHLRMSDKELLEMKGHKDYDLWRTE